MFKPKTTIAGRLENSSGEWIRTTDLRVMSPTSCLCSTPHQIVPQLYHARRRPSSKKIAGHVDHSRRTFIRC